MLSELKILKQKFSILRAYAIGLILCFPCILFSSFCEVESEMRRLLRMRYSIGWWYLDFFHPFTIIKPWNGLWCISIIIIDFLDCGSLRPLGFSPVRLWNGQTAVDFWSTAFFLKECLWTNYGSLFPREGFLKMYPGFFLMRGSRFRFLTGPIGLMLE